MNGQSATASMESLRNLSVAMESIATCRKEVIARIRKGGMEDVIQEIRDESSRRAHDPAVQADFSHAKGQHKLALMYLVDAVFLNAQMDRNDASLTTDLRQAACKSISTFLPDMVRNLTTPSNCEQVDRLLIGWRARKTDPKFDAVNITEATACMTQAKAMRQEQLKRRVASRFVPGSDGEQIPLQIESMFGSFLPRGPPFIDPTLFKPEGVVVDVVRRRLGPMFQPKMRPPAALEFLKFNSDAAGRFQIPGDDPLTASQDWADDEELAVRHQLKARLQAAGNQASQLASAPGPAAALDAKPGQQADQGTGVALGKHGAAPQNGLVIPGIPANALPDAHRVGCESNSGPVGGVHPNSSAIQADRPQSSNPQVSEQHWHPHPEHGLPPPQSLPHSAGHLPPSGNFNATPPWRTPLHGTPNHYLPHPTPQSAHAMPVGHMVYNTLPPQAAPYADYVGYGDSGEYMPPLPSEPYDGDGSPPPPLPDEPPPLPDEPYEVAFPDSQEAPSTYSAPDAAGGAVEAQLQMAAVETPVPPHSPSQYGMGDAPSTGHDRAASESHAHSTPAAGARAMAVPSFQQPAAPPPAFAQQAAIAGFPNHTTPAALSEPPPPLPMGADSAAQPPVMQSHKSPMPPPGGAPPIHPPSHPPPSSMPREWGQQATPPSYPAHQHAAPHSMHHQPEPHYPPASNHLYGRSPHLSSQEAVHAAYPGTFAGSPDRYSTSGQHEFLPPAGPPPQPAVLHSQMSPPRPLQPPPGNPPPIGANPVMRYPGPPAGISYGAPPAAGPMHGGPNAQYHGWGPEGMNHGQALGYGAPPGHPPQQPPPMQQQAESGGNYLPPPPARGHRPQMTGRHSQGKRQRQW